VAVVKKAANCNISFRMRTVEGEGIFGKAAAREKGGEGCSNCNRKHPEEEAKNRAKDSID